MRFFGLYFAFFCSLFLYIFKGSVQAAAQFGADMLFSYFVFTSAFVMSIVLLLFVALKKGFKFAAISPFFGGLFAGAAGVFFATLIANRTALLLGAYLLKVAASEGDIYAAVIGVALLAFGYFVFRPFNFDFIMTKRFDFEHRGRMDEGAIDVEVVEEFDRVERK